MSDTSTPRRVFERILPSERVRIAEILRLETVGGMLLLTGAIAAMIWANWPGTDGYARFLAISFGPSELQLDMSVAHWAGDGLLALFFFAAGLEVKREFVAGELNTVSRAALPILAAVGGMAVPAVTFTIINVNGEDGALSGWAIPSATDIAFALAVLAVISTHLPTALRTFLLTLAVVDDLIAIVIIAIFYTDELELGWLALALVPIAVFGALVQRRVRAWWLLMPLAVIAWALMHASGVHATIAGVLLAFTVPVRERALEAGSEPGTGLAEIFEHKIRPLSSGVAVPVFAFCSAGVTIGGWTALGDALSSRITLGIIAGLFLGKSIGIFATTYLTARFTRATLDEGLSWSDITGLSILGGVGFTVSLLIGELAYGDATARDSYAKVGVLAGSLLAATVAAALLRARNRVYRRIEELVNEPSASG